MPTPDNPETYFYHSILTKPMNMKFCTLFSFVLLVTGAVIAQPQFSRDDLFQPGDIAFTASSDSVPPVGAAGADVTWDFSGMPIDTLSIIGINFGSPDTTEYAADYPDANLVQIAGFGGFSYYQYMEASEDKLEAVGEVFPGFLTSQTFYSDPQTLMEFPVTYQRTWDDTYAYELQYLGSSISYEANGTSEFVVDGYGTVVLPQATFDDALRIRWTSVSMDSTSFGSESERNDYYDTTYVWLSPSYHSPLCTGSRTRQVRTAYFVFMDTVISDSETLFDASFSLDPFAGTTSAVRDITPGKYAMSIAPNPFAESLNINFTADRSGEMEFVLQDLQGRVVLTQRLLATSGENAVTYPVNDLPGGMYVAMLRTESGADVQKLVHLSTH